MDDLRYQGSAANPASLVVCSPEFTSGRLSLVVVCVDCDIKNPEQGSPGRRMQAVSGNYCSSSGFIFECPNCKRRVALAYVDERFSINIQIQPSDNRRKRKPGE